MRDKKNAPASQGISGETDSAEENPGGGFIKTSYHIWPGRAPDVGRHGKL